MKHMQGGKIRGSHTSVTDTVYNFLTRHVLTQSHVTGVSLGAITKAGGGKLNAKFVPEPTRIRATIRSSNSVQRLTIFCNGQAPEGVARLLKKAWAEFVG